MKILPDLLSRKKGKLLINGNTADERYAKIEINQIHHIEL
jgi:hypothetical protein